MAARVPVLLSRATVARAGVPTGHDFQRIVYWAGYLDTDHAGQRNPQLHPDGSLTGTWYTGITVRRNRAVDD